jgi:hypothetical protein
MAHSPRANFFNRIASTNHSAFQHPAQPSAPPAHLAPQPRPNFFQLIARMANLAHLQSHFADAYFLLHRQAIHTHSLGRNILAYHGWLEIHRL